MDKCSCLNPEALTGVLKTIYLFLEGQNFRATCETFLSESRGMGYAELKKAIACILVLKPSAVEVVKVSHVDPTKTELEVQADVVQRTDSDPSKCLNIYYGEPLCMKRLDFSLSSPDVTASGTCPCMERGGQCRAARPAVRTIDNTQNDIETRKILKRAVQEEVKVAPPPPPDLEDQHDRKDKRINFKRSAQIIKQSETAIQEAEYPTESYVRDPVAATMSTSFPRDFSQRKSLEMEMEEDALIPVVDSKKPSTISVTPSSNRSVSDVIANTILDEQLIRSEEYKDNGFPSNMGLVRSAAAMEPKPSTMSRGESFITPRPEPSVIETTHSVKAMPSAIETKHSVKVIPSVRSMPPTPVPVSESVISAKTIQSTQMEPTQRMVCPTSSVRFDIDGRVLQTTISGDIGDVKVDSTELEETDMTEELVPTTSVIQPTSLMSVKSVTVEEPRPSVRSAHSVVDPAMIAGGVPLSRSSRMTTTRSGSCKSVGPSTNQIGIQIGACIKRNVATTSEIPTRSAHTSTMMASMERSASTRSLNNRNLLDYNKIKRELRYGCPSVRIVLLQALRWRITRADVDERNEIMADFARHDLLSLHGTPKSHKSLVEEFFCTTSRKLALQHEEGMARMINAIASLTLGRDYLCQDDTLLTKMIIPLVMDNHPSKAIVSATSREYLLVALQKLSLRNNMRLVMIQAGLTEYLVSYLAQNHNRISEYCLEYCLALFMNLCLHNETRTRLKKKSRDVVKFICDFLSADHDDNLSYINGAMYSLFMDADIRKEAKHGHLDSRISEKSRSVDEEMRQQLEVIMDILNANKSGSPCGQCECVDQDDEIDHLEEEIEMNDVVAGNPNGENLLSLYRAENGLAEPAAIPLTCLCRPATPGKKITAFETCPQNEYEHLRERSMELKSESDKKGKKSRSCFGKCKKAKPESSPKLSSSFVDDGENVLASEECPKTSTICCPQPVDDECIPVRELSYLPSASVQQSMPISYTCPNDGVCTGVFEESGVMKICANCRAMQQSGMIREPSRLQSVMRQESFREPSAIHSVIAEESFRQPSAVQSVIAEESLRELSASQSVIPEESLRQPSVVQSTVVEEVREPSFVKTTVRSVTSIPPPQPPQSQSQSQSQTQTRSGCSAVNWSTLNQESLLAHPSLVTHVSTCMQCCNTDLEQYNTLEQQRVLSKQTSMMKQPSKTVSIIVPPEPTSVISTQRSVVIGDSVSVTSQVDLTVKNTSASTSRTTLAAQESVIIASTQPSLGTQPSVRSEHPSQFLREESQIRTVSNIRVASAQPSMRSDVPVDRMSQGFGIEEEPTARSTFSVMTQKSAIDQAEQEPEVKKGKCCGRAPKKKEEKPPEPAEERQLSSLSTRDKSAIGTKSRLFDRSRQTYVAPSFTRSTINNQSRQRSRFDQYGNICDPCQAANYTCPPYNACGRDARPYCYATTNSYCKNQVCPCPNTTSQMPQYSQPSQPSQISQISQPQRSKYSCECYNNMKSFVQTPDLTRCSNRCSNPRRNSEETETVNDQSNETKKDGQIEDDRLSTPEEELRNLQLALLLDSDNLCELCFNGPPYIDCECYASVFQSRPKLPRTP